MGLSVAIRPSRFLLAFIVATHLGAVAVIWLSSLPGWACLLIDLAVLLNLPFALRRHRWRGERQLRYRDDWHLVTETGEENVKLAGEFFVSPFLIVLRLATPEGKRIPLVLLADSASADELRRLRVLLRYGLQNTDGAEGN